MQILVIFENGVPVFANAIFLLSCFVVTFTDILAYKEMQIKLLEDFMTLLKIDMVCI